MINTAAQMLLVLSRTLFRTGSVRNCISSFKELAVLTAENDDEEAKEYAGAVSLSRRWCRRDTVFSS